jgi:hypothetical protein
MQIIIIIFLKMVLTMTYLTILLAQFSLPLLAQPIRNPEKVAICFKIIIANQLLFQAMIDLLKKKLKR